MRPGITGLAQVNGRNQLDWESRLELDVQYYERFSIWLDLKILPATVREVAAAKGVSDDGNAGVLGEARQAGQQSQQLSRGRERTRT